MGRMMMEINENHSCQGIAGRTIPMKCFPRGKGRGKCHLFLNGSKVCECGERKLIQ